MKEIDLNLDKSKKYVVACSFGPDSMALLASAIENNLQIVVAHVNYRKREAAVYEQSALEKFCAEKNIKIYVLDLLKVKSEGNFQEWARETRYKFFKKVAQEEGADAVLVAHQQDDFLETYLMQRNRKNYVKNPGISADIDIFGVKIIRPLLGYSKADLQAFDDENGVPYSIDESNLTDHYSRNKIRHQIVEKLSQEERKKLLEEINAKKYENVQFKTVWDLNEFLNLSYEQLVTLLDFYMEKSGEHSDLSKKYIAEIKRAFSSNSNVSFNLTSKLRLETDYGVVYIVNLKRLVKYKLSFQDKLSNDFLEIDFSNGAEDRNIKLIDGKYVVKNVDLNTDLIIKDYKYSINRAFIDWKMPHYLREVWPGIYNEEGELLYTPRYRKKFKDNHKSIFLINTQYFTEF